MHLTNYYLKTARVALGFKAGFWFQSMPSANWLLSLLLELIAPIVVCGQQSFKRNKDLNERLLTAILVILISPLPQSGLAICILSLVFPVLFCSHTCLCPEIWNCSHKFHGNKTSSSSPAGAGSIYTAKQQLELSLSGDFHWRSAICCSTGLNFSRSDSSFFFLSPPPKWRLEGCCGLTRKRSVPQIRYSSCSYAYVLLIERVWLLSISSVMNFS